MFDPSACDAFDSAAWDEAGFHGSYEYIFKLLGGLFFRCYGRAHTSAYRLHQLGTWQSLLLALGVLFLEQVKTDFLEIRDGSVNFVDVSLLVHSGIGDRQNFNAP